MKRPLRILVAHNVSQARTGGMSRIMGFIHDHIAEAGHSVEYLCNEDLPHRLNGPLGRFTFPVLVHRHAVAAARRGKPFDIINVHEPSAALVSTLKSLAGNPAVVLTSHGIERRAWELALEERRLGRQGPSFKTRVIYPLTSLWQSSIGLRRADHVFCLKNEDRDYVMNHWNRSIGDITRVFPAADRIYATRSQTTRSQTGVWERGVWERGPAERLLFAATWRKNKGIEDLVPAFTTLAAQYPRLTLTVLGAGVPEPMIRTTFPESVRGRVCCLQTCNEAENAAAYAQADIFVLPSLYEGTPLTLMEAMMSGMPIVTTATCGMNDVIRDSDNGLLIPIRSPESIVAAVERLMQNENLRAALGRAAQQEALTHYTWDRVAKPVQQVYERLCA